VKCHFDMKPHSGRNVLLSPSEQCIGCRELVRVDVVDRAQDTWPLS
jgi:hypothetical protein